MNRLGLLAIAVVLVGACYWSGQGAGGASVSVSVPRGVITNPTGMTLRASFYPSGSLRASYMDALGGPTTDPALAVSEHVAVSGSPIQVDGYDYYEVDLGLRSPTSGNLTIQGVPAGGPYQVHLEVWDPVKTSAASQGVSEGFSVAAGRSVDVAVDLFPVF